MNSTAYLNDREMRKVGLTSIQACLLIALRNEVDIFEWLTIRQAMASAKGLLSKKLIVATEGNCQKDELTEAGVWASIAVEYVGWELELGARVEWESVTQKRLAAYRMHRSKS